MLPADAPGAGSNVVESPTVKSEPSHASELSPAYAITPFEPAATRADSFGSMTPARSAPEPQDSHPVIGSAGSGRLHATSPMTQIATTRMARAIAESAPVRGVGDPAHLPDRGLESSKVP